MENKMYEVDPREPEMYKEEVEQLLSDLYDLRQCIDYVVYQDKTSKKSSKKRLYRMTKCLKKGCNCMKVYLFYIQETGNGFEEGDLYAYTTNKKHAKEFMRIKDMDKFHMCKEKLTEKDFHELKKKRPLFELKLYINDFTNDEKMSSSTYYRLLATQMEIVLVSREFNSILEKLYFECDGRNWLLLKNKYLEILSNMGYNYLYFVHNNQYPIGKVRDIRMDVIQIYIRVFRSTLRTVER